MAKMKILCLHGRGTSGAIFRAQTASMRLLLDDADPGFEFDFVDGPLPASPAPGTAPFFDPPHYAYYADVESPSSGTSSSDEKEVAALRTAHAWLQTILDTRGPYAGVLTFSQGGALLSSFLLYRQWYHPELTTAPFAFAVFVCGSVPLAALRDLGVPVSAEVAALDARTRAELLAGKTSVDVHTTCSGVNGSGSIDYASIVRRAQFDSDDCFGLNLNRVPLELKLRLPTVHVLGARDPRLPAGVQLAGLCDPYIRSVYIVPGAGHEFPRSRDASEELARLLQWAAQRGRYPGQGEV